MNEDEVIETKAAWGKTFVEIIDPTKENHVFRAYFEQPQRSQEPLCPECKAEILYECVACSRNNYPPQRTWVRLTDKEIEECWDGDLSPYQMQCIREIESKLRELNT